MTIRAVLLVVGLAIVGAVAGFGVAKATLDENVECHDTFQLKVAASCLMPTPDWTWVAAGAGVGAAAGVGAVVWRRRR